MPTHSSFLDNTLYDMYMSRKRVALGSGEGRGERGLWYYMWSRIGEEMEGERGFLFVAGSALQQRESERAMYIIRVFYDKFHIGHYADQMALARLRRHRFFQYSRNTCVGAVRTKKMVISNRRNPSQPGSVPKCQSNMNDMFTVRTGYERHDIKNIYIQIS